MREKFGAKNPKSLMLRFHTQTAGVQLTAQQPEVNLVRVAVQGLAAVLGGAVNAIERGFQKNEIERSAYRIAQETDSGERVVVGVNRFQLDEGMTLFAEVIELLKSVGAEDITVFGGGIIPEADILTLQAIGVPALSAQARPAERSSVG